MNNALTAYFANGNLFVQGNRYKTLKQALKGLSGETGWELRDETGKVVAKG
jgi:hypothetical protein